MALISCPECQKEISDKVKTCPHCGFPFEDGEATTNAEPLESTAPTPSEPTPQPVVLTSVQLGTQNPEKKKKALFIGASAVAIIIIALIAFFSIQKQSETKAYNEYVENLHTAQILMLSGGANAETLCNLTRSVWYNTIYEKSDYETDPYTKSGRIFHDDFNTSLALLYADESTKTTVKKIKENRELVEEIMKSLQNPADEFKSCYDTVSSLYESYRNFTGLAISPTGNYNSYRDSFSEYDKSFMTYYDKLGTQIPEKR